MSCETIEMLVMICLGYIIGDIIVKILNAIERKRGE